MRIQGAGTVFPPEKPVKKDEILIYEIMAEDIEKNYWKQLKDGLSAQFKQKDLVVRFTDIELL